MAEPETRRTADDGSKFYEREDPATGAVTRYDSVTSVLGVKDKPGLKWWAAKLAARRAMDNLPKLVASARLDPCGRTYKRTGPERCNECVECTQRWVELFHVGESERRRREGSAFHDVVEWWTLHGEFPPYADDVARYVEAFKRMVIDYGLTHQSWEACEMTVYEPDHGYAGTLDGIVHFRPVTEKAARLCARLGHPQGARVVIDAKTREGEDKALYDEHALQLTAYRWARIARIKISGVEVELPPTVGGVVFQPRPDGYTLEPVLTGPEEMEAFLNALKLYRWTQARGAASIAVGTFPVPDGWRFDPGAAAADTVAGAFPGAVVVDEPAATPPRKTAVKRAAKAAAATTTSADRATARSAVLDSLRHRDPQKVVDTGGRRPGAVLTDDDIPF